jgi:hypothetical protein
MTNNNFNLKETDAFERISIDLDNYGDADDENIDTNTYYNNFDNILG